jgi:TM2 domain-containing membrane protein YozV
LNRKLAAVIRSGLVCPGAGQIYNRQRAKGGLLIAATLLMICVLAYKTWTAALDLVLSMPPEEAFNDIFGLAHRLVEMNKVFYDWTAAAFLVIWVYAVADAYINAR